MKKLWEKVVSLARRVPYKAVGIGWAGALVVLFLGRKSLVWTDWPIALVIILIVVTAIDWLSRKFR